MRRRSIEGKMRTRAVIAWGMLLGAVVAAPRPVAAAPGDTGPYGGLEGLVLADGKPAAGATVVLRRGTPYPVTLRADAQGARGIAFLEAAAGPLEVAGTATTDARGRFAIAGLADGTYVFEAKDGSGRAGASDDVFVDEGRWAFASAVLAAPRRFVGRVGDARGVPAAGARLLLSRADPTRGNQVPHVFLRETTSAADGAFVFDGLPPGSWQVTLARSGLRLTWDAAPGEAPATYSLPTLAAREIEVRDEEGRPVKDALVLFAGLGAGRPRVLSGGRTGERGAFRATLPIDAGAVATTASPRHVGGEWSLEPGKIPDVVRLPAGAANGRVRGRVLTAEGKPVAGVAVRAREASGAFLFPASPAAAISGPDGSFAIEGVDPGPVWLAAAGAGFVSPRLSGPSDPPPASAVVRVASGADATVDVPVVPAAGLDGVVVDEAGAPVAGALVRWDVFHESLSQGSEDLPASERLVRSDAEGRFALRSLAPRVAGQVVVAAPGRLEVGVVARTPAGGDTGRVSVALRRSRAVVVRVAEAGSRAPLAGANVRVRPAREVAGDDDVDAFRASVRTDADGTAVVGPLPRGAIVATVTPLGRPAREVEVAAGDDALVEVLFDAGLSIEGHVRDRAGAPIAGATVWAEPVGSRDGSSRVVAGTDAGGAFRLAGLSAGRWSLTTFAGEGSASAQVLAGSRGSVLVVSRDDGAHVVVVVGPDGKPVPRASVHWRIGDTSSGGGAVVDGRAAFDLAHVRDGGTWTVEVFAPTDARGAPLPYGPVRIGPLSSRVREAQVRLVPGIALSGRLVPPAARDLSAWRVAALPEKPDPLDGDRVLCEARAAADGSFRLPSLGPGTHRLLPIPPRAADGLVVPGVVLAEAGSADVRVPLEAAFTATVTVLEGEKPLPGALVRATRAVGGAVEDPAASADAEGRARLEGLAASATYVLTVTGVVGDRRVERRRIASWKPADVRIVLGAEPIVRGVVRDEAGAPVAAVVLAMRDGELVGLAEPRPDGSFEVAVQGEGPVTLRAMLPFELFDEAFVEGSLGVPAVDVELGTRDVVLVLRRGVRVTFRADADGAPPPRKATLRNASAHDRRLGGHGEVALGAVPTPSPPLEPGGRYRLLVPADEDGRCALVAFEAREGLEVVVRLVPGVTTAVRVEPAEAGAPLRVSAKVAGFPVTTRVEPGGRHSVPGLPPGETVEVEVESILGGRRARGRASAVAGGEVLVRLAPEEDR